MKHNILFCEAYSYCFYGAQQSFHLVISNLDQQKYKNIVVCPTAGPFTEKLVQSGIEVVIFQQDISLIRDERVQGNQSFAEYSLAKKNYILLQTLISTFKLAHFIKKRKIKIVHCNNIRSLFFIGLAAKIAGVRLIWHIRQDNQYPKRLGKIATFMSNKIVLISNELRKIFPQGGTIGKKVVTVYNGVSLEAFRPETNVHDVRGKYKIDANIPLIGMVSSLTPRKGHRYLIEAAHILSKTFENLKILIVGGGFQSEIEYEQELIQLVSEYQLSENVIFTGWCDNIPEILAALDILVLPSLSEGLPRIILEAMAMAKPVVATNIAGIPELVVDGKTGFLVPPQNAGALAEAIRTLISNKPLACKMGKAGRERVETYFSIEQMVHGIEKIYEELIQNP